MFDFLSHQDKVTIISTFLVGVLAGGYLYLVGFAPQFSQFWERSNETYYSALTITGEEYGGCQLANSCPSFQILSNGTYNYKETLASEVLEGRISRADWQRIQQSINANDLARADSPRSTSAGCESYVDGADYSYRITYDNFTYILDTCTTNLREIPTLANALHSIWNHLPK